MFINICSLVERKNRVRTVVALKTDLLQNDIDICVVTETHLKPDIPDSVVTYQTIPFLEETGIGVDRI